MIEILPRIAAALLPVLLFLLALIYLDSYKLVRLRWILTTIALGCLVAGGSYLANIWLIPRLQLDPPIYSRYIAPLVEESAKGLFLVYLIRTHRVGFLVDAAIHGFALGTGFAVIENLYYLQVFSSAHMIVWLLRGFGTAIMHGGATAIFGITSKTLSERERIPPAASYLPGLVIAWAIHSLFNHFFFSPALSTAGILLVLPPLIFLVFDRSEKSLQRWLNVGFDADAELLELIDSGMLSESRVGVYLHSLKQRFRGEVVADLLCYLKVHMELSLRAKGVLMMREHGFQVEVDQQTRAKFKELEYLESSIGRTGRLAMAPFLRASGKELWQLYMLGR